MKWSTINTSTPANSNCPTHSTLQQTSTRFRSLPIQVSMPSSHNRGTVIRTETTRARSASGLEDTGYAPSQEPTMPPFFRRRTGRISCAALGTRHNEILEKHSWERSTLECCPRRKRCRPSPQQLPLNHTSSLHSLPSRFRSLPIQVHIKIKPPKGAVICTTRPDWSSSDLEQWQPRVPRSVVGMMARQRCTTHQSY